MIDRPSAATCTAYLTATMEYLKIYIHIYAKLGSSAEDLATKYGEFGSCISFGMTFGFSRRCGSLSSGCQAITLHCIAVDQLLYVSQAARKFIFVVRVFFFQEEMQTASLEGNFQMKYEERTSWCWVIILYSFVQHHRF